MTILYEIYQTRPDLLKHEIYIDGGVRRWTDVLKALCLGARAVGLGRAFLYANSVWGEEGAVRVVQSTSFRCMIFVTATFNTIIQTSLLIAVMREEIETGMRLLGVTSIDQLRPELVRYVDRALCAKL